MTTHWRCPACQIQIQHNDLEPKPRPGVPHRCHVCRLELAFNAETDTLEVTKMRSDDGKENSAPRRPATKAKR
jgi:hypothetical protein